MDFFFFNPANTKCGKVWIKLDKKDSYNNLQVGAYFDFGDPVANSAPAPHVNGVFYYEEFQYN